MKQDAGFTSARAVSSPLYIKVYVFDKGAVQSRYVEDSKPHVHCFLSEIPFFLLRRHESRDL